MSRLYSRAWSVSLAKHDTSIEPEEVEKGKFSRFLPGVEVTGLRTRFRVERSLRKQPNTSQITISNLNEASRALIQEKPLFVRLQAGYEGNLRQITQGDASFSRSLRERVGWESELHIGDNDRSYKNARLSRSFAPGTSLSYVLSLTAGSMGLVLNLTDAQDRELSSQFTSGEVVEGYSQETMTRLLARHGYGWSVQDGQLQILRRGEWVKKTAILISQDTGMIGVPEVAIPQKKKRPPRVTVRTLLHPEIYPGVLFRIESRQIKGNYVAQRVVHVGDSHGQDWYTEVEGRPPQ